MTICGEPLRSYEWPGGPAVLEGLVCGKRAGHESRRHRSVTAMEAARQRGASRQPPTGSPLVAAAIRRARVQAGLTQRHLAAVVGVTETAVQHYEYAKRTPSAEMWVQLELALGPLGVVREVKGAATKESRAALAWKRLRPATRNDGPRQTTINRQENRSNEKDSRHKQVPRDCRS